MYYLTNVRTKGLTCVLISLFLLSNSDAAIDIIFDYSYDTGNYFGDEQRYIMEQVAYVFESRLGEKVLLPQILQIMA